MILDNIYFSQILSFFGYKNQPSNISGVYKKNDHWVFIFFDQKSSSICFLDNFEHFGNKVDLLIFLSNTLNFNDDLINSIQKEEGNDERLFESVPKGNRDEIIATVFKFFDPEVFEEKSLNDRFFRDTNKVKVPVFKFPQENGMYKVVDSFICDPTNFSYKNIFTHFYFYKKFIFFITCILVFWAIFVIFYYIISLLFYSKV